MTPLEWSDDGRKELFAAYVKAQLSMGAVTKDRNNEHFKTQYATLSSACAATIPAFNAAGLAVIQSPSFDGEVLTVETLVVHEGGGWLKSVLNVKPMKPDAQGIGSAITYLRRYGLMSVAGVAPEDDDGNAASADGVGGKPFAKARNEQLRIPVAVTAAQTAITMAESRADLSNWKKANIEMINSLPSDQADAIVRSLNERWEALAPLSKTDAPPPLALNGARNGHARDFGLAGDDIPEFN